MPGASHEAIIIHLQSTPGQQEIQTWNRVHINRNDTEESAAQRTAATWFSWPRLSPWNRVLIEPLHFFFEREGVQDYITWVWLYRCEAGHGYDWLQCLDDKKHHHINRTIGIRATLVRQLGDRKLKCCRWILRARNQANPNEMLMCCSIVSKVWSSTAAPKSGDKATKQRNIKGQ